MAGLTGVGARGGGLTVPVLPSSARVGWMGAMRKTRRRRRPLIARPMPTEPPSWKTYGRIALLIVALCLWVLLATFVPDHR